MDAQILTLNPSGRAETKLKRILYFLTVFIFVLPFSPAQGQYPEGFAEEVAFNQFNAASGILFADTNLSVVWELSGKIWLVSDGTISPNPIIDISEEVAFYADLGMIGAALHPDFLENGFIYLFYTVDTHYLRYFGTPEYDPATTETQVSMGRITRYTVNLETLDVSSESRKIILGDEIGSGLPICTVAHGVGQLIFGEDGSLLVTTGDGNTWVGSSQSQGFNGEGPLPEFANDNVALELGILSEEENLGAFRSQFLDGLNGKVLRVDPETGHGLPNNPFFEETDPSSPRSKIWALGFRNPYRFTVKPGTGGGDLFSGHPGTIVLSDVGDWVWEEINFITDPGGNYGWPIYQGPSVYGFYAGVPTENTNAPNPLGSSTCHQYLDYQDVILEENVFHEYFYPNPCDPSQILNGEAITTFVHQRPVLSFANSANETSGIVPTIAALSTFNENGGANYTSVTDAGVAGENFTGISGSGGIFLQGDRIPEEYQDWYTFADFSGWLRAIKFDETDRPEIIETWNSSIGPVIHISQSPYDQCLYVTTIAPSEIKRICFGGNLKPVLEVTPDTVFGMGSLTVDFDASASYDPEGEDLTFTWTFEDGSQASGSEISKTFQPETSEISSQQVHLRVEDESGVWADQNILVSLNNTPPDVSISSIAEGELYSTFSPTLFNLVATAVDNESSAGEISYNWTHILHHNTHFHYLESLFGNNQILAIYPTGCSPFETYWYEIHLEAIDPGGLRSTDSKNIFPDCEGTLEFDDGSEAEIVLSPNPVGNQFTIKSSVSFGDFVDCEIYGTTGKSVLSERIFVYNGRKYFRLTVDQLPKGMYTLELTFLDKRERVKFIKN